MSNNEASFFQRNIAAIWRSNDLRIYGFFLALVHVLTFALWSNEFKTYITGQAAKICWPFFTQCQSWQIQSFMLWDILWYGYLILSVFVALLFLFGKGKSPAYFGLIALNLTKYFVLIQDLRLWGNFHYMAFIVTFVFLFLPQKIRLSGLLIILFYCFAGTLKLDGQWLAGRTFQHPPYMSQSSFALACKYVAMLELVIVFGLLSRRKWIRYTTFFQLMLFHFFSVQWVGFMYPAVMICLLALFLLCWEGGIDIGGEIADFKAFKPSTWIALALFVFCQAIPYFYRGDPVVTGEGRMFALDMYDGNTVCLEGTFLRYKNRVVEASSLEPFTGPRVHCSPILFFEHLRRLCESQSAISDFVDADIYVKSRRSVAAQYENLIAVKNFCSRDVRYKMIGRNNWVDEITPGNGVR